MHKSWRHRAVVPILASNIVSGCKGESTRESLLTCPSPDGAHIAEFYRESGGGAAGWQAEYVSVRRADGEPTVILQMSRGYDVVLNWQSPTVLEIGYPDDARVVRWQSDFDFAMQGTDLTVWRSYLRRVPSQDGSFVTEKLRCDGSVRDGK